MLHKDKENSQDIENQDYPGEPNSKPGTADQPEKNNPKKVPESNDPAGYSEDDTIKETPSGQRDSK